MFGPSISLSFLQDYPTLAVALWEVFKVSRSHLKKFDLNRSRPIKKARAYALPLALINHAHIGPIYSGPPISILFEDENLLAFHKPAGVHGHPLNYLDQENCLSYFRSIDCFSILKVNCHQHERGLLYRLDKETSGLMIGLKGQDCYDYARSNFSEIVAEKIYLAVVDGNFNHAGEHHHWLRPGQRKGKKMLVSMNGPLEERASLTVEKLTTFQDRSLLKIFLHTGQRHQIRAQLSFLGHPILGDELYGGRPADRLYLHAYRYSLALPERKYQLVDSQADLFSALFPDLKLFL